MLLQIFIFALLWSSGLAASNPFDAMFPSRNQKQVHVPASQQSSFRYEGYTRQNVITGCQGVRFLDGSFRTEFYVIDASRKKIIIKPEDTIVMKLPATATSSRLASDCSVSYSEMCFPAQCGVKKCGSAVGPMIHGGASQMQSSSFSTPKMLAKNLGVLPDTEMMVESQTFHVIRNSQERKQPSWIPGLFGLRIPPCSEIQWLPPVVSPPALTSPVVSPPVLTPPVVSPPVLTPPVVSPPALTPPVESPPAPIPPVVSPAPTPPVESPPAPTPPVVPPPSAPVAPPSSTEAETPSAPAVSSPSASAVSSPSAPAVSPPTPPVVSLPPPPIVSPPTSCPIPAVYPPPIVSPPTSCPIPAAYPPVPITCPPPAPTCPPTTTCSPLAPVYSPPPPTCAPLSPPACFPPLPPTCSSPASTCSPPLPPTCFPPPPPACSPPSSPAPVCFPPLPPACSPPTSSPAPVCSPPLPPTCCPPPPPACSPPTSSPAPVCSPPPICPSPTPSPAPACGPPVTSCSLPPSTTSPPPSCPTSCSLPPPPVPAYCPRSKSESSKTYQSVTQPKMPDGHPPCPAEGPFCEHCQNTGKILSDYEIAARLIPDALLEDESIPSGSKQRQGDPAALFASLPGAIRGHPGVIYYPSCDRDAFRQVAVVPYCEFRRAKQSAYEDSSLASIQENEEVKVDTIDS